VNPKHQEAVNNEIVKDIFPADVLTVEKIIYAQLYFTCAQVYGT